MNDLRSLTINGVTYEVTPGSHAEDTSNPHVVTNEQVGARSDTWIPTAEQVGARSDTWVPTAEEVGARPDTWTPTASEVGARPDDWVPTAEEVGARPADWTPTAEEVGAAKSGYGYGGQCIALKNHSVISNDDELSTELSKVYDAMASGETKLITFMHWSNWRYFGILAKSSANNGSLVAHSAVNQGTEIVKTKYNGTWQYLEWVNPPLNVAGAAYKTTERYMGKPVYVKVFDFGALPNASTKQISHDLSKTAVVGLSAISKDGKYYFPSTSNSESVDVYINANYIVITATGNWSSVEAYVVVKYTE